MTDLAKPITNQRWTNAGKYTTLLVIVCGSLWLLLANLGNQYLWQDEAQTALVSKTILTYGVPRGYDGKNSFSQQTGDEYGDNYIWRWHTWLPFYVLAGFYKIFGVSTFVSRLPFALFGFGTVMVTYFFAKELWSDSRIPLIAAGLLAISVPFLLLCRQCRYYSAAMFFSVLSLYAYVLLHRKKYATLILFVSSTLLFHSQHFYVAVLFAAILLHACIFRRDRLITLLVVIVVTMLINAPWLIWLSGMKYHQQQYNMFDFLSVVGFIRTYCVDVTRYVFPLWLLAVLLIVALAGRLKTKGSCSQTLQSWEKVLLLVFFVAFNIIIIASIAPAPFFRYIAPSIPPLIILIAVIIDAAARVHFMIAAAVVVLLLATGQLKDFLYEITHDFNGPIEGIVRYLNERGSPDDIVAITYGDMPLKFYTNMRVIGGLTGEDLEPAKNARWVIVRKYTICSEDTKVKKYLLNNIEWHRYRRIVLDCPDTPWENKEDPDKHYFRTSIYESRVVIHKRID